MFASLARSYARTVSAETRSNCGPGLGLAGERTIAVPTLFSLAVKAEAAVHARAASAAMCPANVETNVFRLVSSDIWQKSPVVAA